MLPSFLTMAVLAADAAAEEKATKSLSINDPSEHSFDWVAWLIILTVFAIVAFSIWHLLATRRRRIERRAAAEQR